MYYTVGQESGNMVVKTPLGVVIQRFGSDIEAAKDDAWGRNRDRALRLLDEEAQARNEDQ